MEGTQESGGFMPSCWYKEGSPAEGDLLVLLGYQQLMDFVFLLLGLIPTSHECITSGLPEAAAC